MIPAGSLTVILGLVVAVTCHDHPIHELAKGQFSFALKLYESLSKEEGNLLFSPATLQTMFGVLYLTADGNNALQLAANIGLPHHTEDAPRAFREMWRNILNANEFASTYFFNDIFYSAPVNISEDLRNTISKNFHGNFERVGSEEEFENVRSKLNSQLEKLDQKKFRHFANTEFLTNDSILAVSGFKFSGDWTESLVRRSTNTRPFHVNSTSSKAVPMLTGTGALRTIILESPSGARALELPYKENELLLTILLPKDKDGLPALEQQLKDINMRKVRKSMEEKNVEVTLPLIEEFSQISFKESLIKLGLVDMFDLKAASFPGLIDAPLPLSDVIQETYVKWTSNGTELGSVLSPRAADELLEMVADYPFIYIIEEPKTEALIAVGRYVTP